MCTGDRMDHSEDVRSVASQSDAEGSESSTEGGMGRRAGKRTTVSRRRGPYHRPAPPPMPPPVRRMKQVSTFWKDEADQRLTALVVNHPTDGPILWSEVAQSLKEEGLVDRNNKQCKER